MMTGRYGQRYLPTAGGSAIGGVVIVGFGVVWTLIASVMAFGANRAFSGHETGPNVFSIIPCVFPLFGVLFVTVGIVMSVKSHQKAGEYQQAEQSYRQKRAEIHTRYGRG
jgi:ABC-type Na+ efflux pump permease subunit